MPDLTKIESFIREWSASGAHERRFKDHFFLDLCEALGVPRPDPKDKAGDYCFEKEVVIAHPDGRETTQFIDFYKKGCFVIEAKQGGGEQDASAGTARRGTSGWDKAMRGAYGQALRYAKYLPEGTPPFLVTCDIGECFEIWPGFSGHYGDYGARITYRLADLLKPETAAYFTAMFTDPLSLDPARHAQRVTREVAAKLAALAKTMEGAGHDPELVSQFLMRCLFTMFAEDVGLLPENLFTKAISERWMTEPRRFQPEVEQLWRAMNDGLPFGFEAKLLRFNGGLFATAQSLPLTSDQLGLLLDAAKCDWSAVEPSIFGTLLERALDEHERHRLGAHFTPREYIERLVRPAVIEPIREEWLIAQAQVRQMLDKGEAEPTAKDRKAASEVLRTFHAKLAHTRVLDPACGSGNFLYVALDLFKQIEAEVVRELGDLGETQAAFEMQGVMVNPGQFLGIEINPRAREIADLVLWIGYLQWYRRAYGNLHPVEPILREYRNIVCRDAVLDYDDVRPRLDEKGKPVTVWDMRTYKTHPVTSKPVPDEDARVPVLDYLNAHPAEWPEADYVVSNPPFIGQQRMRMSLGDGYVESLRGVYPTVPETVDLVMYWWEKAALLLQDGKLRRFGFITTNSLTQVFNRRIMESHLNAIENPIAIAWAIPDHPWVDAGADVRIAMTIGVRSSELVNQPTLGHVIPEGNDLFIESKAKPLQIYYRSIPHINSDLSGGPDLTRTSNLKANQGIAIKGFELGSQGFLLEKEIAEQWLEEEPDLHFILKPYMNGRDLVNGRYTRYVIDFNALPKNDAIKYSRPFQHVYDRTKADRTTNRENRTRSNWWLFRRSGSDLRTALKALTRFIGTTRTSKYRHFQFLPASMVAESKIVVIATSDAYHLGVLSSNTHILFATRVGGWLGVGDDPTYNHSDCFNKFPFPDPPEDLKLRIRDLGERLDTQRKRIQAELPDVTLTAMYNALERLREIERDGGPALSEKERAFHDRALIGILKQIHDDLDTAVAAAYGWPTDLPDDEILNRLVALNRERAEEEKRGLIRWLRPEFQNPAGHVSTQTTMTLSDGVTANAQKPFASIPWPEKAPSQIRAIRDLLASRRAMWTVEQIAVAFKNARKSTILQHLQTLENLGLLMMHNDESGRSWSVVTQIAAGVVQSKDL